MISQEQMKEWISEAISHFKKSMPPIDVPYPEIHFTTFSRMDQDRPPLVKRLQCPTVEQNDFPAMEELHGTKGDAILIYKDALTSDWYSYGDIKGKFFHDFWHELGHFYSVNKENPDYNLFFHFMNQQSQPEELDEMRGYLFWQEFIADVIAYKVTPDQQIDWTNFNYFSLRDQLAGYLYNAFNYMDDGIVWYSLALYMAKILSDKLTIHYFDAANRGILTADEEGTLTFSEAGIDPSVEDDVLDDEEYVDLVNHLKGILENQLSKENYLDITPKTLTTIGAEISFAEERHSERIGHEKMRQRLKAAMNDFSEE